MDKNIESSTTKTGLVEWETEEFDKHERSTVWYLGFGTILLLALAYTVYIGQWLLSALIVMVGVSIYLSGRIKPNKIKCLINERGVSIGDKQFGYDQLKTFWFSKTEEGIKLNLITIFRLMPVVSIKITNELEPKIREALMSVIPESKNKKEDWIDRAGRILKV